MLINLLAMEEKVKLATRSMVFQKEPDFKVIKFLLALTLKQEITSLESVLMMRLKTMLKR